MGDGPLRATSHILRRATVGGSIGRKRSDEKKENAALGKPQPSWSFWGLMELAPFRKLAVNFVRCSTVPEIGIRMRRKRSLYVDCGVVVLLVALLAAVNHGYIRRHAFASAGDSASAALNPDPSKPATSTATTLKTLVGYSNPTSRPEPGAYAAPVAPVSFRPLNFALLRGGFTSTDEFFERVNEDPILHSFYGDCADRDASMHPLSSDMLVFTAFRRGTQIKWAKRPLLVRKGEYVMTYCGKTVLARCGNLISMAAMQPSEDIPPGLLETPVDAVVPPVSYGSEPVAEFVAPAGVTPVPAAAVTPVAAHPGRSFFFIPPFYLPPGHGHSPTPPAIVTPPAPPTPPVATPPPPSTPPSTTPPPNGPPPSTPPPSGPPSAPPSPPPGPPTHVSGDEFSDHGAAFTLLFGLLVIGVVKLFAR